MLNLQLKASQRQALVIHKPLSQLSLRVDTPVCGVKMVKSVWGTHEISRLNPNSCPIASPYPYI